MVSGVRNQCDGSVVSLSAAQRWQGSLHHLFGIVRATLLTSPPEGAVTASTVVF